MLIEEVHDPRRWYSTNLVGVSSQLLASVDFNDFPRPLFIAATRQTHPGLFSLLANASSQAEAAELFTHYMELAFALGDRPVKGMREAAHYSKSSYLKLLSGWGFDSNAQAGAVLKAWVESRFGIVPTFHKGPLDHFPSEAWMHYLEEKLSSRFHNNCIQLQLDVLYEYCQFCLARFRPFAGEHVTLHRGIQRAEAKFVHGSIKARAGVLRLNNLVSFSASRERAEEFGDLMLCARAAGKATILSGSGRGPRPQWRGRGAGDRRRFRGRRELCLSLVSKHARSAPTSASPSAMRSARVSSGMAPSSLNRSSRLKTRSPA